MATAANFNYSGWAIQSPPPIYDGNSPLIARETDPVPDYFVANSGSDAADGLTSGTAWQTIAKVNTEMSGFSVGEKIGFNRGDTFSGTLAIASKTGTLGNEIVFGAYGSGVKPIITHATVVSDFVLDTGNIYKSTSKSTVYQAFKDGAVIPNVREPKLGATYTIASLSSQTVFICTDLIGHADIVGATIFIRSRDWHTQQRTVTAFTSGTGQVTISGSLTYSYSAGNELFVSNHTSLLTAQDEWCFDGSGDLYYYSTTTPSGVTAVENNANGITITNSDYINIDNLNIKGVNDTGIDIITGSTFVTVDSNNISYCYQHGIDTDTGTNIVISNNDISYTNYRAIECRSDGTVIELNNIHDIGLESGITYKGHTQGRGIITYNDAVVIRKNTIENTGYVSISFLGINHVIEDNFIKYFCIYLSDGGGIYTFNANWLDDGTTGSVIQRNIIIGSPNVNTDSASPAIYMDDRVHDVTIDSNYASETGRGVFLHNTADITVTNNEFYNCWETGIQISEDANGGDGNTINNIVTNNIVVSLSDDVFTNAMTLSTAYANNVQDFGTFNNNTLYDMYTYGEKVVGVRSSTVFWKNVSFLKDHTLAEWVTLSSEGAGSTTNGYRWEGRSASTTSGSTLISNGLFETNTTGWTGSSSTISRLTDDGNYMNIRSNSASAFFYTNVNFSVTSGVEYVIEFDIKSDADRTLEFFVSRVSGGSDVLVGRRPIHVNNTWARYNISATPDFSASDNRFSMELEASGIDVQIDNVRIIEVTSWTTPAVYSQFVYNETAASKNITIAGTWEEADGTSYTTTVPVAANSAKILLLSSEIV